MPGKIIFTKKQEELIRIFKRGELRRINILEGSVRSGKTWISLVLWASWAAISPREYQYMMCAKSLQTLKRNCLEPLAVLMGRKNFRYSLSKKEGFLFGRKITLEGANDARSESKIRGLTLGGAYCDELTLFPEDFFTMLLSRLSAPGAKLIATTNPDVPTHWLLTNYLQNPQLEKDVLRVFFHIDDNTTLPAEYVQSLKAEYTGVYYDRFIRGEWVVANGAVYRVFSDNEKGFYAGGELPEFEYINVGLDFGGNGSQHALAAVGITRDYKRLYALVTRRFPAKDITPPQLYGLVYGFCESVLARFGKIHVLYADSAEQTLIAGLRPELARLGIPVKNALKREINDRIRATTMLMASRRFFLIPDECETLIRAFEGAVWSDKIIDKEVRLDNGTSDIDTLDAFEYAFERFIPRMVKGVCSDDKLA